MWSITGRAGTIVLLIAGIALAWRTSNAATIGTGASAVRVGSLDTLYMSGAGSTDSSANMSFTLQTDGNIMALLHQANLGEIQAGQLAQQTAQDSSVRGFAQRMVTDHTALDQAGDSLAQRAGITPQLPDSSMVQEQQTQMQLLQSQSGSGFDTTYMSQQIVAHQQTIALVDSSIAHASNADLKTMLTTSVKPRVAEHLQLAQDIQRSLQSGTK
jgi:putative membrane protein